MIKAEYKIFDDETGEVWMHGIASPDEERDYPEIVNVNSNGAHEIVQNARREYDFSFTIGKFFHEDPIKRTDENGD